MSTYFNKMSIISLSTAVVLAVTGCGGGGGATDSAAAAAPALNGSAGLSGSLGGGGGGGASPAPGRLAPAPTADPDASAQLIVDLNKNGTFGDSKDIAYTSQVVNGAFNFSGIKIAEEGVTEAQLTVLKRGFAPVVKVVTLSNGQTLSIITEAGTVPLQTEIVALDRNDSNVNLKGAFLKMGLKTTTLGVRSYSKIMSLSQLRAEAAEPDYGTGEISTSVIPLDAVPDSVTEIRADMKAFDPTNPEDSKFFPGEYKGVGKSSGAKATGEERQLVSVGFDLISLTDQNGEAIELDASAIRASKLRPQSITWSDCLQTKVRYLSDAQVALIVTMGDDDNTTADIFEIPMWYYDYGSGMWQYLGEAEYTEATATRGAHATMCITENWGQYLNLDYDFAIEEPKNICVSATDQDGVAVGNLAISAHKDTSYTDVYLDSEGKANLGLTLGNDPSDYLFSYSGALTRWARVNVDASNIVVGQTDLCDYDLSIVVQNPYTTTLKVTAEGTTGVSSSSGYVTVSSSYYSGDYFYEYSPLDVNGTATFKVAPNTDYTVQYNSQTVVVNADGTVTDPETSDSGSLVEVTIQDVNRAPDVYVNFNNSYISDRATQAGFYVAAIDPNGDTIALESLTLNDIPLVEGTHYEVTQRYSGDDYDRFHAVLDLTHPDVSGITALAPTSLSAGAYSLVATYSDATASAAADTGLFVMENQAPVINGIYFHSAVMSFINVRAEILAGTYNVTVNAYDPDGDDFNVTYRLDDGDFVLSSEFDLVDGEHNITVKVTEVDGTPPLFDEETYRVVVGNRSPTVGPFHALIYDNETLNGNLIDTSPNPVSVSVLGETPSGLTLYFTGAYTFDGRAHNDLAEGETRDVVTSVRVTNNYGSIDTNLTVIVTGTNDAPTLTVPVSVVVTTENVEVPYIAADVDSAVVTVSATAGDGEVTVGDTNLTYTPNDGVTSDSITVVATDGDLNVTKVVIVLFGNQPPSFQDQQEFYVQGGDSVNGTVSFSDDNVSSPATIAVNGTPPAGFVLNPDGSFTYNAIAFAELTLGTQEFLEISVTVTDSEGLTATGMVFIMIEGVYEFFEEGGFTQGMSIYGIEQDGEGAGAWLSTLDAGGAITETTWYLDTETGEFVLDTGTGGEEDTTLYLNAGVWSEGWDDNNYELISGNIRFGNGMMVKILNTIDLANPTATDAAAIAALSAEIPGSPTFAFSAGAVGYVFGVKTPEIYMLHRQPKVQVQNEVSGEWEETDTPFSTILAYMGSVNSPVGRYNPVSGWTGVDFERYTSGEADNFHAYPVVDSTGDPIGSLSAGMTGSLVTHSGTSNTQTVVGSWNVVTLSDGEFALELAPTPGNEDLFIQYANLIAVANGTVYQGLHRAAATDFVVSEEDTIGLNSVAFNDIKDAIREYVTGEEPTISAFLAGRTLWAEIGGEDGTLERQEFNATGTGVTWTEIVNPGNTLCTGTVSVVYETNGTVTVQGLTDSCGIEEPNDPFNISIEGSEGWNYILVGGNRWYFSEADARADFLGEVTTPPSPSDGNLVALFVAKTLYMISTNGDGEAYGTSWTFGTATISDTAVYSGYTGGVDANGGYGINDTPPNQTLSYVIDGTTLRITEVQNGDNDGGIAEIRIERILSDTSVELSGTFYTLNGVLQGTNTMVVYTTEVARDAALNGTAPFSSVAYFSGTKYFVNENGLTGYRAYDAGNLEYTGEINGAAVSGGFVVTASEPNSMQIIKNAGTADQQILAFTYSEMLPSDGVAFDLSINGGTSFETYMYDTVAARDAKATSLGF